MNTKDGHKRQCPFSSFGEGKSIAKKSLDHELLKRFEMLGQLDDRERDAVLVVIDSIVAKHRLKEVIGS